MAPRAPIAINRGGHLVAQDFSILDATSAGGDALPAYVIAPITSICHYLYPGSYGYASAPDRFNGLNCMRPRAANELLLEGTIMRRASDGHSRLIINGTGWTIRSGGVWLCLAERGVPIVDVPDDAFETVARNLRGVNTADATCAPPTLPARGLLFPAQNLDAGVPALDVRHFGSLTEYLNTHLPLHEATNLAVSAEGLSGYAPTADNATYADPPRPPHVY